MSAAPVAPRYLRLPGTARGVVGSATLWLGADHALLVQSRGYSEVYRRFYFRDVEALLLRRTTTARTTAFALLAVLVPLAAALTLETAPGRVFWGVVAAPFVVALAVHLARGPSCVCHVRTAVETAELAALRRLRPARRALERLRERVEAAQGRLATDELLRPPAAYPAAPPEPPAMPAAEAPPQLPVTSHRRFHWVLFPLLLADAGVTAAQTWAPGRAIDAVGVGLAIVQFLVAIGALVESRRGAPGTALHRLTVAALVYVCVSLALGWGIGVVRGFRAATLQQAPTVGSPVWLAVVTIPVVLVLGVWGLALLARPPAASPA